MTTLALAAALLLGGSSPDAAAVPPPMPPQATLQLGIRARKLAYGSYFWAGYRADYGAPALRKDLPRIALRRGQIVEFRLGFRPDRLTLRVAGRRYTLTPARRARWRVVLGGLAVLEGRLGLGYATYLARFTLP